MEKPNANDMFYKGGGLHWAQVESYSYVGAPEENSTSNGRLRGILRLLD